MTDMIIIGSGPAGLSAAVYGKRAGLDVLVVEKEYEGCGQIAESGRVDNYLGFSGISGYDLGERFRAHAAELGAAFLEREVQSLEQVPEGWQVSFTDGGSRQARTVIYSAGAFYRPLNVPGEKEFVGKGVSYCALCDGAFYKNKTVAVVGGGDTALEDALYLSDICGRVYLIHRREQFRGALSTEEKVRDRANIELVLNAEAAAIIGTEKVCALGLRDGRKLAVDGVFSAIGSVPKTDILRGLVPMDEQGYVIADETGRTRKAGLFAAGDVRAKRLRQIVTAVSDGANAATAAVDYLRKER